MTRTLPLFLVALVLSVTACDSSDDEPDTTETATATIAAPVDTTTGVTGTVQFEQDGETLTMTVSLAGLTPGQHGFHIHTVGDCGRGDHDDDGFEEVGGAALGHYDPYDTMNHGAPTDPVTARHAGDFGNVTAGADGRATATLTTDVLSLSGTRPVQNRAVIVHSMRDDLTSDPAGMSGDRVGCGVITLAPPTSDD